MKIKSLTVLIVLLTALAGSDGFAGDCGKSIKLTSDEQAELPSPAPNYLPDLREMESLLQRLDEQVKCQKQAIVRMMAALKDGYCELTKQREQVKTIVSNIGLLRQLDPDCHGKYRVGTYVWTQCDINEALQAELARYVTAHENLQDQESMVEAGLKALEQHCQRYQNWNAKQTLLTERFHSFKNQVAVSSCSPAEDFDAGAQQATKLADKIDDSLKVEKATAEVQQKADRVIQQTSLEIPSDIEAEVDRILKQETATNSSD